MQTFGKLYSSTWDPEESKKDSEEAKNKDSDSPQNDMVPEDDLRKKKKMSKEAKAASLELVTFMISNRYSFKQIVRLGGVMNEKFGQRCKLINEVSQDSGVARNLIIHCVGKDLQESLFKEVEEGSFSITLDTTTVMEDQILVIRARFLTMEYSPDCLTKAPTIHNHIVAVEELEESSIGKTFFEILTRKVLYNDKLKKGSFKKTLTTTMKEAWKVDDENVG